MMKYFVFLLILFTSHQSYSFFNDVNEDNPVDFFYDNYANTLKRNTYTEKLLKGIHESIQAFRRLLPSD